jgi:hypothetical protein
VKIKEDDAWGDENSHTILAGNFEERYHLEDVGHIGE